MDAENFIKEGCPQRDTAEQEGYVGARRSFRRIWKERDSVQPELLEDILDKDNMNRAYKRVKANKEAPGIDGMTVEEALPYLRENGNIPWITSKDMKSNLIDDTLMHTNMLFVCEFKRRKVAYQCFSQRVTPTSESGDKNFSEKHPCNP